MTDPSVFDRADATCDGGDLDCGSGLLLIIRSAFQPVPPGGTLLVKSRETSVREDLPAWCRLVGHTVEAERDAEHGYRHFLLRKKADDQALAGDLPRAIRAAAGAGAGFPVSGFTRKVDWAGSALVDFTYLDLVLERGLDPIRAVQETRRLVAFASSTTTDDAAIPATDLAISAP